MPQFIHTIRCKGCRNNYKELRDDDQYFKPTAQCYELARDQRDDGKGCARYLRWEGWTEAFKPQRLVEPTSDAESLESYGVRLLNQLRNNGCGPSSGMIAVLHDPRGAGGGAWIVGKSGSGAQGKIPDDVWKLIPSVFEPEDMCFGRACAEVDALRKLYAKKPTTKVEELADCRFIAMDTRSKVRGPCRNCSAWLKQLRIRAYWKQAWSIPA